MEQLLKKEKIDPTNWTKAVCRKSKKSINLKMKHEWPNELHQKKWISNRIQTLHLTSIFLTLFCYHTKWRKMSHCVFLKLVANAWKSSLCTTWLKISISLRVSKKYVEDQDSRSQNISHLHWQQLEFEQTCQMRCLSMPKQPQIAKRDWNTKQKNDKIK